MRSKFIITRYTYVLANRKKILSFSSTLKNIRFTINYSVHYAGLQNFARCAQSLAQERNEDEAIVIRISKTVGLGWHCTMGC